MLPVPVPKLFPGQGASETSANDSVHNLGAFQVKPQNGSGLRLEQITQRAVVISIGYPAVWATRSGIFNGGNKG